MPPALWRSFPLCFIRYGFSRAPGVFQLRNSPGSKERSDRGDFAKGCLLPSRTPAVRLRAPASRAHARGPHLLCLNVCAVTSLLRPTAVTGRPGRDAAPRALSPGAAPLCAFARCRRSESRAGVPGRGETPFASPQRPRPASGAGTAPGPTQEAPPCWPPPGRPANLSRAGPASFPFSRPGNSAGAGRMAASASFYTHYTPETQPLRTDCLRVTAGKGLRAPGGRKEGGMGGEGGGQGGVRSAAPGPDALRFILGRSVPRSRSPPPGLRLSLPHLIRARGSASGVSRAQGWIPGLYVFALPKLCKANYWASWWLRR